MKACRAYPIPSIAMAWRWPWHGPHKEARMPEYKLYNLKITTITPLHIGTGRALLHEYDYAVHDRKTWVINQSALLEAQKDIEDPKVAHRLATVPPAQLLADEDFVEGSRLFRYVLKGRPRSEGEGIEVQEQFKDV